MYIHLNRWMNADNLKARWCRLKKEAVSGNLLSFLKGRVSMTTWRNYFRVFCTNKVIGYWIKVPASGTTTYLKIGTLINALNCEHKDLVLSNMRYLCPPQQSHIKPLSTNHGWYIHGEKDGERGRIGVVTDCAEMTITPNSNLNFLKCLRERQSC